MNHTLYDQFHETCLKYSQNEAVRFESHSYSYSDFDKKIAKTRAKLNALGVKENDVVSLALPNCPLTVSLFYALSSLGAISYNIHPLTKPNQMKEYLLQAKAKYLFCLAIDASKMRENLPLDIKVISINPYRGVDFIKSIAFSFMVKEKNKDVIPFEKIKGIGKEAISFDEERDAVYLNTGGTKGDSKIVRLSSRAINYLASQGYDLIGGDVRKIHMLTAIPLFHGFGLAMGVHTPLSHGASTVLMMKFSRKEAIHHIQKGQATVIIGVPALYEALLSHKSFYGDHLQKQIVAFIGGDNVKQSLLDKWNSAMESYRSKARLYEGYGLTETSTAININCDKNHRKGSVGLPLPKINEAIRDIETGKLLGPNEKGEILIESPTNMTGYLHEEESQGFVDIDGHHYLSTQDYGYIDSDGYLYFIQRMRRIVKINGETLCPRDVESVVLKNSNIYEAFCYGVKDERKGHVFALSCSIRRGSTISKEELTKELYDAIEKELPSSYKPKYIELLDKLPHTQIGKIDEKAFEEKE